MLEQERSEPRQSARMIDSVRSEEVDNYLKVPGWRIWSNSVFDAFRVDHSARIQIIIGVQAKDLTLRVDQNKLGYREISNKVHHIREIEGKSRIPLLFRVNVTDLPWYLLDPLTPEEVKKIDQADTAVASDKPYELLRPDELAAIFRKRDDFTSRF